MTNIDHRKFLKVFALTLSFIWAGFWIFFGVASGFGEKLNIIGIIIHTTFPGLIFLFSVLVALRFSITGGIILLIEGIAIAIAYPLMVREIFPLSTIIYVILTMAIPPVLSGVILLLIQTSSKRKIKLSTTGGMNS